MMKRRLVVWLLARLGVRKGFIEVPWGGVLRIDGGARITGYDLKMQGHVSGRLQAGAEAMNVWRKPCEHGEYLPHSIEIPCPGHFAFNFEGEPVPISCTVLHYVLCEGGSPVTAADLEALGHKAWWCDVREELTIVNPPWCHNGIEPNKGHEVCGYHLLIPIPESQETNA